MRFKDRTNAGNILAAALKDKIKKDEMPYSIVLGIPRGGVVVADIVANKLSCHFDIIIPRKDWTKQISEIELISNSTATIEKRINSTGIAEGENSVRLSLDLASLG
jgi:predicted phosphoribosyltransferase